MEQRRNAPGTRSNCHLDDEAHADDYAESLLLYARVKGTPEEAKMRALMPERFRVLDTM